MLQCCPQLSVRCSKLAACNCLYSEQSPTFHTPQQHHWHSLTSRNMQRIILQVGPNANCPLFLSRLTTVAKFLLPKLPHFKQIRSQPLAVLTSGQTRRSEMARVAAFPCEYRAKLQSSSGRNDALKLSFRPLTLFTAVSLLYVV